MIVSATRSQANLTRMPRKVKAYDVEKKELIGEFETLIACCKHFGINPGSLTTMIRKKSRCYKNNLNRTLTFR